MKVGDLYIYHNRKIDNNIVRAMNGSVVVIMEAWKPHHVKIMVLKTGQIIQECWIGHLEETDLRFKTEAE